MIFFFFVFFMSMSRCHFVNGSIYALCRLNEVGIWVQLLPIWEESICMIGKQLHKRCHFSAPWPEVWHSGVSLRNMISRVSFLMQNIVITLLAGQTSDWALEVNYYCFIIRFYCISRQIQIGWC